MENITRQVHLDQLFTALVTVEGDAAYLHSCSEHLAGFAKEVEATLIRRAIRRLNAPARAARATMIGVAPPPPTHDRVRRDKADPSIARYRLTGDLVQT